MKHGWFQFNYSRYNKLYIISIISCLASFRFLEDKLWIFWSKQNKYSLTGCLKIYWMQPIRYSPYVSIGTFFLTIFKPREKSQVINSFKVTRMRFVKRWHLWTRRNRVPIVHALNERQSGSKHLIIIFKRDQITRKMDGFKRFESICDLMKKLLSKNVRPFVTGSIAWKRKCAMWQHLLIAYNHFW